MTETIFEKLKEQHAEAAPLIQRLTEEFDRTTFERLRMMLHAHLEAEEYAIYSRLRSDLSVRGMVLEGLVQHRIVRGLLRQLRDEPQGSEEWMARMKVLRRLIERHFREEEIEFFPAAQRVLEGDDADEMTFMFEAAEERVCATV